MRKFIVVFIIISLLFTFSACKKSTSLGSLPSSFESSDSLNSHTECTYSGWKLSYEATCTEEGSFIRNCTVCKKTETKPIPALGHTTDSGVCTRCNENFGTWELGEFKDEFGQSINKKYISTTVYGTFSNSATTNSELIACVQITSDDIAILLWEYGSHLVKCSYKYDEYSITMLDTNNKKHYLSGTMYAGGNRIYIDDEDKATVINALKKSGKISFYVVYSEFITSTYLFSIETSNFQTLYRQL